MPSVVSLVAVSGSLHSPSKTTVLASEILDAFAGALRDGGIEVETHLIELSEVGRAFSGALRRDELGPDARGGDPSHRVGDAAHRREPRLPCELHGPLQARVRLRRPVLAHRPARADGGDRRQRPARAHHRAPVPAAVLVLPGAHVAHRRVRERRRLRRLPHRVDALRDRIGQAASRGVPVVRGTLPDAVSEYVATW